MKTHIDLNPVKLVASIRGVWLLGALAAGLMLTLAPPVSAGTIGISGFTLIVGTEPGDGNQSISFSILGSDLVISGTTFDVVTAGCSGVGTVTCALADFNELIALGGDGDDVINLSAISSPTFTTLILGGPGNDVLIGSGGDDTIFGGPGDDVLEGGPGDDCLNPGSGNNITIQAVTASSCFDGPEPVITPLPRSTATPEPNTLLLLGTGISALGLCLRRHSGALDQKETVDCRRGL
jgi:Ca2+-binding RTX toxin-like protein